jgi:hypothetical protein
LSASEPADVEAIASASMLTLILQNTTVLTATIVAGFSTFNRSDDIRQIVKVIS